MRALIIAVAIATLGVSGCGDDPRRYDPVLEGTTIAARRNALEVRLAIADTMIFGRSALQPMLERVALEDPYDETRMRALEVWTTLPHPLGDESFLLRVISREPHSSITLEAARAYPRLWGEEGLRLLFRRFEECGSNHEITSRCPSLANALEVEPRKSMALLMGARDVERSPRGEAELALYLAGRLIMADSSLRDDSVVRAWLEAFRAKGETARIRKVAQKLLKG